MKIHLPTIKCLIKLKRKGSRLLDQKDPSSRDSRYFIFLQFQILWGNNGRSPINLLYTAFGFILLNFKNILPQVAKYPMR